MRNIFKLMVVYILLQQISHCYRWYHIILVTKRSITSLSLKLSDKTSKQASERVSE